MDFYVHIGFLFLKMLLIKCINLDVSPQFSNFIFFIHSIFKKYVVYFDKMMCTHDQTLSEKDVGPESLSRETE